jgi:hypothetical protein
MGAGIVLASGLAQGVSAHESSGLQNTVAALENRVQQLESEKANSGGLIIAPNTTLRFYGYAKADLIYDLDYDLGNTIFGFSSLNAASVPNENFRAHAFQSRIGLESVTKTQIGDLTAKIEGDFFGSGGGQFRLRHAYGQIGGLMAGQTWTTFMPIESYPGTLDFQGPAGIPFARVTQARYTYDVGNGFKVSGAVENDPSALSDRPAIVGAASYSFNKSFVKVAAVTRGLAGVAGTQNAYGVNVSGNTSLWQGGRINASFTSGEGIGSYMVFGGTDLDTAGNTISTQGYTVGLEQDVGDKFTFGVAYGRRDIDAGAGNLPTDTAELETIHVTAKYKPVKNVSIGLEYINGRRTQFNNATFSADRIQSSVQFNF